MSMNNDSFGDKIKRNGVEGDVDSSNMIHIQSSQADADFGISKHKDVKKLATSEPKRKKAKKDVFTVNFYYDGCPSYSSRSDVMRSCSLVFSNPDINMPMNDDSFDDKIKRNGVEGDVDSSNMIHIQSSQADADFGISKHKDVKKLATSIGN
nr:hypothetical protein [Tanacetum cinerariifolium]